MKTVFFIAFRYFISKKKTNFIQVITWLSLFGVAIGAMALIVVLSVFNGLEETIFDIYSNLDPDIKIERTVGKSFEKTHALMQKIHQTNGIAEITEVIEDNVLIKYIDNQTVVRMKGVSDNFVYQYPIAQTLVNGTVHVKQNHIGLALLGRGVQYRLGVDMRNSFYQLQFWYPKRNTDVIKNPESAFEIQSIYPGGVFAIEKQYDDKYVFVPLEFAQQLMQYGAKRTSLELKLKPNTDVKAVQQVLKSSLGPDFKILTKEEQHAGLLRAIRIERLFLYVTFSIILLVSSLNIFFSLTMLVLDKRKDIQILHAMGAEKSFIRNIFLAEGIIIATLGSIVGLTLGFFICYLQQEYGIVSMGTETSLINTYPVRMRWQDFIVTGIIIFSITTLISLAPARAAYRNIEAIRSI